MNTVLPVEARWRSVVAHGHDAGRIQPVGGLVEQEQPRVAQQRRRDPESLLHPEGVALDLVARPFAEADELEQLLDPTARGGRAGGGEGAQVLAARQVRVEGRRFDQRTDLEQAVPVAPPNGPPSTSIVPASGAISPVSSRIVVVLPAPLGPRKP